MLQGNAAPWGEKKPAGRGRPEGEGGDAKVSVLDIADSGIGR
jgi:hypothetical protein